MKGILLAAGQGTRLLPLTLATSKHLLSIYSKPMIFYSLSSLLLAGIRDVTIVSTSRDIDSYRKLFSDGARLGIQIQYAVQDLPNGIVGALLNARHHLEGDSVMVALGDNLFFGAGLGKGFRQTEFSSGARVFVTEVLNPQDYGVLEVGKSGNPERIFEKPEYPSSSLAVTGLYVYDKSLFERAALLEPSKRGELEISDLNNSYLSSGELDVVHLPRGTVWMDAGTIENLSVANDYVRNVEARTGILLSSPEEIAWRSGFISDDQLEESCELFGASPYGNQLRNLLGA